MCFVASACGFVNDPVVVESSRTPEDSVAFDLPPPVETTPAEPSGSGNDEPTEAPSPTSPTSPSRSTSAGDQRFPELGSADIDVVHYLVKLAYRHDQRTIDGTLVVTGTLLNQTDQIALDADGPYVTAVRSGGASVDFVQAGRELLIALGEVKAVGSAFGVEVDFSVTVGEKSFFQGDVGLFPTPGGLWSVNEPDGASTWLPLNDHPTDKATWAFEITAPKGLTAIANGELSATHETLGGVTWSWQQTEPMAPYLITLLVGDYELVDDGTSASGVDLVHAVLRSRSKTLDAYRDVTRQQLAFFESLFGAYPFDRYGVAITDSVPGLAMETQGLSLFSSDELDGSLGRLQQAFLSHELAHQWFGDAVSPATWNDIWLNEGFATYAEWLWMEEVGFGDVQHVAEANLSGLPATGWPLAKPEEMFGLISYNGGATVLHALRLTVGDDTFFAGLRNWVATYLDDSATTAEFQVVMEESSGTDLDGFFDTWVYADSIPSQLPKSGAAVGSAP